MGLRNRKHGDRKPPNLSGSLKGIYRILWGKYGKTTMIENMIQPQMAVE